jgi:hypothetical protein
MLQELLELIVQSLTWHEFGRGGMGGGEAGASRPNTTFLFVFISF